MAPKPPDSPATLLRKAQTKARNVHWEATLLMHMRAEKFHPPQLQYKFHPTRKWAFDFAWPEVMLAAEVDGGSHGVSCGTCRGKGLIARSVSHGMGHGNFRATAYLDRCPSCGGNRTVPGRHTSGTGFENDLEKMNEAQALGWRVFRFTPDMIKRGEAVGFIQKNFMRRT